MASLAGTKEEADKVQFEINGKQVTGWLMWFPFQDGDEVEVVAEPLRNGTYRTFAVLRPSDRTISLYPHCSRGRWAFFGNAVKVFALFLLSWCAQWEGLCCLYFLLMDTMIGGVLLSCFQWLRWGHWLYTE
ncbi:putative type VI secretion system effector [Burkholderia thailandensis]|uniref:putative type VI secretion system effector n=1 Tax=Burkholderia thailandensis TaxID=57975 RepID=UPI00298FD1F7|nr:putative type VI secretion system effector [Burkholderia thailandensis]